MPITVNTTGSGSLGNINPGWSVQEFATPASPAERAGGTGMVSFSGAAQDESVLLINNASTVTEPTLGDVSGVIRSVSQSGLTATLTQDTKLARFDADRQIPPMAAASVPGALDLADQLTGTVRLAGISGDTSGALWTLAGHNAGFDGDGDLVVQETEQVTYEVYNSSTTENEIVESQVYQNAIYSDTFTVFDDNIYASGVTGDSHVFVPPPPPTGLTPPVASVDDDFTKVRLFVKSFLSGEDATFSIEGYPSGLVDSDRYQNITVTVDYSAAELIISADYRSGGFITNSTETEDISSLDLDEEICLAIDFRFRDDNVFNTEYYIMTASVCNTSDYSTSVQTQMQWTPDFNSVYFTPWVLAGNLRHLWYRNNNGDDIAGTLPTISFAEYVNNPAFTYPVSATVTLGQPSIGFDGNVWEWLQDACTVYRWEIGLDDDEVETRPLGGRVLDVTNYSPSPVITPTATFTGRQIDVNYTGAVNVNNGIVYEAREDDNRIISVGAAQTTVTKVQTDAYLTSVLSPRRTTAFIPADGTYYVIDSTGLPIVADQWEDYGGRVDVAIDPEVVGGVTITVTGPTEEIPSTTAPYSLAVSDGENQYAALSFYGSGVLADPATLNLLTGADPEKTPTQVATTINNPFIATREQAYDTGIWASVDASGPRVGLSLTIPVSALTNIGGDQGFGVTPGSLINWRNSTYRVVDCTIRNLDVTLTCVRHVTVADFDAAWDGETVADHDAVWDGYLAEDQKVLPYKGTVE